MSCLVVLPLERKVKNTIGYYYNQMKIKTKNYKLRRVATVVYLISLLLKSRVFWIILCQQKNLFQEVGKQRLEKNLKEVKTNLD